MPDRKLRVFLCHASQDKPVVRELYQKLLSEDWIDPWLDVEKILPGQDWDLEIEKAMEAADAVIVLLSHLSVNKEGYVQKELRKVLDIAAEKCEDALFLFPLRLDECNPPRSLQSKQYVDFFPLDNREWAYKRLHQALSTRLSQVTQRGDVEDDWGPSPTSDWTNPVSVQDENYDWLQIVKLTLNDVAAGKEIKVQYDKYKKCSTCKGTGLVGNMVCKHCNGRKQVMTTSDVYVRIPPGVKDGAHVKAAGYGLIKPDKTNGDLYLVVSLEEHLFFQPDGLNVYMKYPIPDHLARRGGDLKVPQLGKEKAFTLVIPPNTQDGQIFRCRKKGLPKLNDPATCGDMFISVETYSSGRIPQTVKVALDRINASLN